MIQLKISVKHVDVPTRWQFNGTLGEAARNPACFADPNSADQRSPDAALRIALDTAADQETITLGEHIAGGQDQQQKIIRGHTQSPQPAQAGKLQTEANRFG